MSARIYSFTDKTDKICLNCIHRTESHQCEIDGKYLKGLPERTDLYCTDWDDQEKDRGKKHDK